MADFISFQPSDFFNTKLYTGNASTQSITGVGFQPDFTSIKRRDGTYNHYAFDAPRGAGWYIKPNQTAAQVDGSADHLTAWTSDGFNLGSTDGVNASGDTFASWNWKGGTTSGIATNGSTTITPSAYSFSQTAGCSIIKYTGNGTAGAKLAHGLGAKPDFILIKGLDATTDWDVYHSGMGATQWLELNSTGSVSTSTNRWNDTEPDSVNITLGDSTHVNDSSDFIAYCFSAKRGFSSFGTFTGNASATNGPFVYTGFRPGYVLVKVLNYTAAWIMFDSKRLGYNLQNKVFTPNTNAVEEAAWMSDIYSNGFKPFSSDPAINGSYNYIYMSFAEFPIVSSNSKAGTGR